MSLFHDSALVGASGQGGGAGYQISRSLRFNSSDSAYLSRTPASAGNRKTWTWAGWVKLGKLGSTQRVFKAADTYLSYYSTTGTLYTNLRSAATNYFISYANVYRDPSAWYHIVLAVDTTQATAANRQKLYVNGVQVTASGPLGQNYPPQNEDTGVNSTSNQHQIAGDTVDSLYFDGYLADVHFIDGQALDPSSFVETSATTGQLIPKAYTGSFGTNGFWLKFSDNSAATATTLGKDYSGNNNNWTPNNLSVLSSYTDTFLSRKPDGTSWTNPTYAFDGTTANYADGTAGNGTVSTIRFNKPLTGVTLLEYFYDGTSTYGYNSTDVGTGPNLTGGSWVTVYSGSAITVNNVRCTSQPGNGVIRLYAIRVNGTILNNWTETDPPGCDSTVDTPTSGSQVDTGLGGQVTGNYCTLNPLAKGGDIQAPTNGNLQVTSSGSGYGLILGTIGMSSGKWYWEVTTTSANCATGIATNLANLASYGGADAYSWVWASYSGGSNKRNNNSNSSYGSILANGDVVGIAFDADNGTLTFYKNNVSQGAAYTGLAAGTYLPVLGDETTAANIDLTVNFGQRPFAYTAPSGFKALCDTNLPAPVVAKPSTVMDVKLYTGNGSTQTISGLGFSPDFVWIKQRDTTRNHVLYDTVRGATKALLSSTTDSEQTYSTSLTAFNSDGFALGSDDKSNGSSGSYAAWAWDAGSTTVTNTQGSITSQVRANASAGFSVATLTTPSSGNFTVGHGLNIAPSLVICKARNQAFTWIVYHKSAGAGNYLVLNTTAASTASSTVWQNTDPSSTLVYGNASNWGTADYVMYSFAPVAGYSSFGSYTGNGSSDGPFVFTGMRPRWVLIKQTDVGRDWRIYDTSRNPYNLVDLELYPNAPNAEAVANGVDSLSNGFKLRSSGVGVNSSGGTYIYAAFAENPFQYARAR